MPPRSPNSRALRRRADRQGRPCNATAAPTPAADAQARLTALYASMPAVACKGLCHDQCTAIAMTRPERDRIRRWQGLMLPLWPGPDDSPCRALTADKRCSIHKDRPFVCRQYGAVPALQCPHGCEPPGGLLTDAEGRAKLAELFDLAGQHDDAARVRARDQE